MHALIIGMTGSGKSYLAAQIATRAKTERNRKVILYDPIGNAFPCDIRTSTADALLKACADNPNSVVFVDEAPTICNNLGVNKKCEWLATMSRHKGLMVYFMAQDAPQIAPIYRRNCTHLYLLSVKADTAELLAREFGSDELMKAFGLKKHWYYYMTNFDKKGNPFKAVLNRPKK
jgi:type IV secretory pathway VirB4 component